MLAQIGRFTSVGIAATLLHVLSAVIAQYQFGLSAQMSNLAGFCAAFSLSYMGHSQFTFQVQGNHATHFNRFLAVSVAGLGLSAAITYLVHDALGAPFIAAMFAVAISVPAMTFLSSRYWAFSATSPRSSSHALGIVAILGMGALCFVFMQNQHLNHDTAWYLVATRKWLGGMRLYVDVIEVNPPLNFYFTAPAIWIANATGLDDMGAQTLLTSGMMSLSLVWVWHLLQRADEIDLGMKYSLLAGAGFALFVPFVRDFAQREHTLMIFLLPYLVGLAVTSGQSRLRAPEMARAIYAGLGLCLKPHFMLIPLAISIGLCMRNRSVRPLLALSNWVFLAMGLGYVVLVRLLHPEYLNEIVPMAVQVYGAYGFSAGRIIANANPALLGLFALLSFIAIRTVAPPAMAPVFAANAGAVTIYLLQWTGYGYQAAPFIALISFASVWLLALRTSGTPVRIIAAACLCIVALDSVRNGPYRSPVTDALTPYVQASGPGRRLAVLSSSLWPGFPLTVAAKATWTSRYPALWTLPGALNKLHGNECRNAERTCREVHNIMVQTRTHIVSDVIKGQPDLLVIDNKPFYFDDPDFNYVDFLSGDARFEPFMRGYTLNEVKGNFTLYRQSAP